MKPYLIDQLKDLTRLRLSREWKGDSQAYLYHEAKAWLQHDWLLTDDHIDALISYQRDVLYKPTTNEGEQNEPTIF